MGSGVSFRLGRNPSRINAEDGDRFLQADFSGLLPPWKPDSFRLADHPDSGGANAERLRRRERTCYMFGDLTVHASWLLFRHREALHADHRPVRIFGLRMRETEISRAKDVALQY